MKSLSVTALSDVAVSSNGPGSADPVVVSARGEFDLATAPGLRDVLLANLGAGRRRITVDLAEVTFMDAACVGALLEVWRTARGCSATIEIARPSKCVLRVIRLAGLERELLGGRVA